MRVTYTFDSYVTHNATNQENQSGLRAIEGGDPEGDST